MKVYIRSVRKNKHQRRFLIISGTPETHDENITILEEWFTRRQAVRNALDMGYELVIRGRADGKKAA